MFKSAFGRAANARFVSAGIISPGKSQPSVLDAVQDMTAQDQKSYCFASRDALGARLFGARLALRLDLASLDGLGFGRRSLIGIGSWTRAIFAISASNSVFVISLKSLFSLSFFSALEAVQYRLTFQE